MMRLLLKKRALLRTAEWCVLCVANGVIGFLFLTLGFALAVAFCHIFGLDTQWAANLTGYFG